MLQALGPLLVAGRKVTLLDGLVHRQLSLVQGQPAGDFVLQATGADGGIGPGPGLGSLLLHRLMGLEAKEAQYADGAAFVRSVVTRIGHEGLNAVWADPELLPTPAELARPDVWVRRVS